jgi:hypothetical protein
MKGGGVQGTVFKLYFMTWPRRPVLKNLYQQAAAAHVPGGFPPLKGQAHDTRVRVD